MVPVQERSMEGLSATVLVLKSIKSAPLWALLLALTVDGTVFYPR